MKDESIVKKVATWYFSKKALPYWAILFFDCLVVLFSGLFCYTLDNGITETIANLGKLTISLLVYLIPYIIGFRIMRTYHGVFRFSTFKDLYRIVIANLIAAGIIILMQVVFNSNKILTKFEIRDMIYIYILITFFMFFVRIFIKNIYERLNKSESSYGTFVYGVKTGGIAVAKSLESNPEQGFLLKGFVSDADDMVGKVLMGVKVFKNDDKLPAIMRKNGAKSLLVSSTKSQTLAHNPVMVDRLIKAGIKIHIVSILDATEDDAKGKNQQVRDIEIEDLLPRDKIEVDLKSIEKLLKGKRIFITGSAGSIGSEMVRQIASFEPEQLILIDEAETPQHDIRLMLQKKYPHVKAESIVTSITKHRRMENLFKMYKPDYVFHAAAYKHVPMMENNPSEAVHNNIDGTRIIADLSVKYGVKKFVMISTDKAVNPTNVMGCSKRICEIYVQSLDKAIKDGKIKGITQFVTTRFGNVLGSNGSVIPLFREQIKNGGPVTVTHPDIVRFFMLIPEACQLVLEAVTMGNGGEIFVFDMGKPVKIVDLAKRMIDLSGAKDVKIEFTGLRDGEKLYEEVLNDEEKTLPTFNTKIKIAQVREYDYQQVCEDLNELLDISYLYDDMNTVKKMKDIVPEYKSQNSKYQSLDKNR